MNPELKKKWVEALRSGEYKQGKEALRSVDNKYCCLGVLCDFQGRRWYSEVSCYAIQSNGYKDISGEYDERLISTIGDTHKLISLINMNDSGKSFKKIANYIEKEL